MEVRVHVRDGSGTPVAASAVSLGRANQGFLPTPKHSSAEGLAEVTSVYGFRSSARVLQVQKQGYKPYSVQLEPEPGYRCEIVLQTEDQALPSSGSCVRE
jgi:hypothetical protein